MSIFLDTNAVIGYCFPADRWHPQCDRYIDKQPSVYTSNKVLAEWYQIKGIIEQEHTSAILEHAATIIKKMPETIEITERNKLCAIAPNTIKPLMRQFYERKINYPISKNILYDIIQQLVLELESKQAHRFLFLKSKCKVHNRIINYPKEDIALRSIIHDSDRAILIDAHDLILSNSFDRLDFVTTDDTIVKNDKSILSVLKITLIIDLRYNYFG